MSTDMTTRDVAELLATTPDEVRSMIRAGELKAHALRANRKRPTYRISPAALANYRARTQL